MMSIKEITEVLKNISWFRGLKNRQLENIAKRMVERKYKAGAEIVTQGKGGEGFFLIVTGKAQAIRTRLDGEQVVVNEFGPGDFFGELALLDDGPRTATILANEDTNCLVLVRWEFLSLLNDDAEMAVNILQELARRFRIALESL
jgi:CRP/FNR family cyclic AMP-dependent transcriptional regulator